ncbi:MAG: ribosomal-processing cysteine protease Prp [Clostridium fessum]
MIQVDVYCRFGQECTTGSRSKGTCWLCMSTDKDIICAAVSVLAVNMANSVETVYRRSVSRAVLMKRAGQFTFPFTGTVSAESKLLMDSLILGLTDIAESYGDKYIKIRFREV